MRSSAGPRESDGFRVKAYAGTTGVLIAFDISENKRAGLLGFAVSRESPDAADPQKRAEKFLSAALRFPDMPKPKSGDAEKDPVLSDRCPIQKFRWSDYTVYPGSKYVYRVFPVRGTPAKPVRDEPLLVKVKTQALDGHEAAIFNRAVVSSQAFARKFPDIDKDLEAARKRGVKDVSEFAMPQPALDWLSRGLFESMQAFLRSAKAGDGLDIAIYEYHLPALADEVKAAHARGVNVRLLYHSKSDKTSIENKHHVDETGLPPENVFTRKPAALMHDKFVVLRRKDGAALKPSRVLCGSTNWTHNGVYRQANVVHMSDDSAVCASYQAMFEKLAETAADAGATRKWVTENNKIPADGAMFAGFSPRSGMGDLAEFVEFINKAGRDLMFSTAFDLHKSVLDALLGKKNDSILRVGVQNTASTITGTHRDRTANFTATALLNSGLEGWIKETTAKQKGSIRVHTKAIVTDFTSDSPSILSGSHNLSENASGKNDENYLMIRGNTDLADIYGCEIMRIYDHYRFRFSVKTRSGENKARPPMLTPDHSWSDNYFKKGSQHALDRLRFSGQ
jgi:phosphatidylserine/phosphatidylglycerophosphate/cardiolipin synthase-like enzyme